MLRSQPGPPGGEAEPGQPILDEAPAEQAAAPAELPRAPSAVPPQQASIGDRLVAQFFDGLVALGLFVFFGMLVAVRFGGTTEGGFELTGLPAAVVTVAVALVMLGYFVVGDVAGATLGKLAVEIRVRTVEDRRVSPRAALVRNLFRLVDGIGVYLVGAIFVLLTKRRQRLGDLVAGTIVVRRESGRAVRAGGLFGAVLVAVAGIAGAVALRVSTPQPVAAPAPEIAATGQQPTAGVLPTPATGRQVGRYATTVLTDDRTGTTEKTTFSPATPTIFVRFTLAGVPPNTVLRSVWIAENVQGAPAESQIDSAELTTGAGANQGNFLLNRPTAGWPVGSYRVELYLAGQLAQTLRFRIEGPASPRPGSPVVATPTR